MSAEQCALPSRSIHQLCSGQVITSPAIVVKELVENALDAGSDYIEIRLKENGLHGIEVCDNGCGIEEDQFQNLTRRHHTSKITVFSDLETVKSFGFRGEALSSLCYVADVVITTKTKTSEVAYRLEFGNEGGLRDKAVVGRDAGTTVALKNLFKSLPVREKELQRNIKREYQRLLKTLQSYALIWTQVRILCTNQVREKPRAVVFSTDKTGSLLQNIGSLFGSKIVDYLAPVDISLPHGKITGYLSKSSEDSSKSFGERQFFFLNQRPVDLPKIQRTLNSIYRQESCVSMTYSPIVFLHFHLPRERTDVNLTPDKRSVVLQDEQEIIQILKAAALELWEKNRSSFQVGSVEHQTAKKPGNSALVSCITPIESKVLVSKNSSSTLVSNSLSQRRTSLEQTSQQSASIMKRKISEIDLQPEEMFAKEDTSDLGPCLKKTIPTFDVQEIKRKLKNTSAKNKTSHHFQEMFSEDMDGETLVKKFDKGSFEELKVIDQHASDEKATFEKLIETTKLTTQPLLSPLSLQLSPVEADIIRSHTEVFALNGFEFEGLEDLDKELKLISIPCSQKELFTESDLHELVQKIQTGEGAQYQPKSKRMKTEKKLVDDELIPRPTKVRSILAMRACRASVMFGKPLTYKEMEQIVHKLSSLLSPWNCPHGRPTMRHLCIL